MREAEGISGADDMIIICVWHRPWWLSLMKVNILKPLFGKSHGICSRCEKKYIIKKAPLRKIRMNQKEAIELAKKLARLKGIQYCVVKIKDGYTVISAGTCYLFRLRSVYRTN